MTNPPTFTIGLTMAGAISAGAYTAGVLDVLFRALDAHNTGVGAPGGPKHKVAVKVMSGASAGGVSTSLAVAALIKNNFGGRLAKAREHQNGYTYGLDAVHDVWVERLDLMHEDGESTGTGFLTTSDLKDAPVRSALNSKHIDQAADKALSDVVWSDRAECYDFLARELDLFVTTTNLMGVPYAVPFAGAETDAAHVMAQHSVARHFRVSGLGKAQLPSPWLDAWRDHGITLELPPTGEAISFADMPDELPTPWVALRQSSTATGAFPFGLSPRVLRAEVRDYGVTPSPGDRARGGAWLIEEHPNALDLPRPFHNRFSDADWQEVVPFIAVDGGVANNEPFEIARFTIRETMEDRVRKYETWGLDTETSTDSDGGSGRHRWLAANDRRAHLSDRAVIMIDPFPEGPEYSVPDLEKGDASALGLLANLKLLPGALKDQARFKPGALLLARDDSVASRFLIAPTRDELATKKKHYGSGAIACGLLGGFGGFIDRKFREHDFRLGQHNCASFLARHFVLDPDSPLLGLSAEEKAEWRERMHSGMKGVPIVHPVGENFSSERNFSQPDWPQVGLGRLTRLLEHAQKRMSAVGGALIAQNAPHWGWNVGGRASWWLGRGLVTKKIAGIALGEMIGRDQIEDFHHVSEEDRKILAALGKRGSSAATAGEIAVAMRKSAAKAVKTPSPEEVKKAFDRYAHERDGRPSLVWSSGGSAPRYTLTVIRPSAFKRARLIGASLFGRRNRSRTNAED